MKFTVTTKKDTVAKDTAPAAYYCIEGTKRSAWEPSEFIRVEEWLRGQQSAPEAKAEATAEKGHAADQLSGEKATHAEKEHAADQPQVQLEKGDKATQGSGRWRQKLWSTPGPPPGARTVEPAMKKAPRSSAGRPLVADDSDTDISEEWSEESVESDTIASRVRDHTPNPEADPVQRQKDREEARRKMEARKAEDKKIFDCLKRRYKRQTTENEMQWMTRIWETEREQVVTLSTRLVENVANVRAPLGAQRNRQLQSSAAALAEFRERRPTLWRLQGAMRRAGWLLAGRTGHLPNYPVAYHSPQDEGALHPSRPSRHSFVVGVDREGEETWIVDPLHSQPAQDLAVSFHRAGFTVHAVQDPWPERVAQKQNCSCMVVKAASAFTYKPTDEWKIPEPGDLFNKDKSMTEQHREEQRSTLEWLRGWNQIKVQGQSKRRGKYVP